MLPGARGRVLAMRIPSRILLLASVLLTAALVGAIMLTRSAEEEAEDALA